MNKKHANAITRLLLTFAILVPLTFAAPVAPATSQCTTRITAESPTQTFVRTFTYVVFGTITGNWTVAYTAMIHGVKYNITANTQCAPS